MSIAKVSTFADARRVSKELIAPLSKPLSDIAAAKRKLASATDAAAKSAQQSSIDELQASVNRRADQALGVLSQAARFANGETPRSELNNVRYLQAYCHFAKGRYSNSAVIGKFLMEKYPTIEWSQQSASLMVRSYEQIFDSSTGPARETAKSKVINGAAKMMNLWPDSSESSSAAVTATRVAVLDDDFDEANQFFESIPADSPLRSQLASRIGQQIWSGRKSAVGDDARKMVVSNAKKFLGIAIESAEPAAMSFATAVSYLYYVDACRESGELDEAVSKVDVLLDDLDSNPAISKSTKFRQSVYNTSLNVYLDALGTKSDVQSWVDKAKLVIGKMGSEAEGNPAATKNVSRVYRKVAGDLTAQFESLPMNEKKTFATSLKSFFSGIGSVAKDGKTRMWAGSTLLRIAESLKLEGAEDKSKELAGEAISLLESAKKAGFGKDAKLEVNYQQQLALAQRSSGDYAAAVVSFEKILEKSNSLSLQIDAAKTLLMLGVEKKDKQALTSSMNGQGNYRDPKTKKPRKRISGWKSLVDYTRNKENLIEQFRECLYYKTLCRLRYGEVAGSKKAVNSAHGELTKALKRFDNINVGPWKKKYDQLLKDIEAAKK